MTRLQILGSAWRRIDGEADNDRAGWVVSLSADGTIALFNDDNGSKSGHVRVYEYDDSSSVDWVQRGDGIDGEAVDDRYLRKFCVAVT
jgi:hypothetical protein